MNSITRLILRRVISENLTLTPQVLEALKECDEHHPPAAAPENSANEPAPPAESSDRETPPDEKHLTFVNPLPGRWIRQTECGVGVALLLAASVAQATSSPGALETANNVFAQGKYSEAVYSYETIIAQQGYSAPVLFNLANAQQRDGQLAQAILSYERAALLTPNDPDISSNLNFARQKAGIEPERQSPVQKAARALTLNGWFCVAVTALFFLAAAFPVRQLRPQLRRALNWSSIAAALAFAIAATAIGVRQPDLHRAVVIASEATASVSPVTVAQPVFKLRPGEIVNLQQAHDDFARIRNQTGHAGWVKADEIARIIPAVAAARGS
jgi:tetratricopeptide (TPR) repeat protein